MTSAARWARQESAATSGRPKGRPPRRLGNSIAPRTRPWREDLEGSSCAGYSRETMRNSVRRFRDLPRAVLFEAMGRVSPKPIASSRSGAMPASTR